jgi:hypothetical protein
MNSMCRAAAVTDPLSPALLSICSGAGGAGGYIEAVVYSPFAHSYHYEVGQGGTGSAGYDYGYGGEPGGGGFIIVEEFFQ